MTRLIETLVHVLFIIILLALIAGVVLLAIAVGQYILSGVC